MVLTKKDSKLKADGIYIRNVLRPSNTAELNIEAGITILHQNFLPSPPTLTWTQLRLEKYSKGKVVGIGNTADNSKLDRLLEKIELDSNSFQRNSAELRLLGVDVEK